MFCLMEQSRHLLKSGRMMQTGIKLLSTRANPDSNTMLKDPVRQVFISQSNDVFTNLALEDWLYKNHDFDHKVRGMALVSTGAMGAAAPVNLGQWVDAPVNFQA